MLEEPKAPGDRSLLGVRFLLSSPTSWYEDTTIENQSHRNSYLAARPRLSCRYAPQNPAEARQYVTVCQR